MGPGKATSRHRHARGRDRVPLFPRPLGGYVVLHILRWAVEVRDTRLLLENLFVVSNPTANQNPVRLLGGLDRCQSKRNIDLALSAQNADL